LLEQGPLPEGRDVAVGLRAESVEQTADVGRDTGAQVRRAALSGHGGLLNLLVRGRVDCATSWRPSDCGAPAVLQGNI